MHAIDVIIGEDIDVSGLFDEQRLGQYADAVLKSRHDGGFDVNIVFVDDMQMTTLNQDYKKGDGTTDVLTFILSEEGDSSLLGEIYVSLQQAIKQADEYDVTPEMEIVRLVTHGLLHLTGMIHDTDGEYDEMMTITEKCMLQYSKDN